MDLTLSDEQRLLKESAEKLAGSAYSIDTLAGTLQSADGFSRKLWSDFAELGWLALPIAEADGGLGGGAIEVGLIMETFGQALLPEPYVSTVVMGARLIARAGTAGQREAVLPGVIAGTVLLAFAQAEKSTRLDPMAIRTRASKTAEGWSVTGEKVMVLGGHNADFFIVSALLPEGGTGLFLVPADTAGLGIERLQMIDGQRAANLVFDNLALPETALLGDRVDRSALVLEVLDHAVLASANAAVGSMDALLAKTAEYLNTRVQFGAPLARNQALRHRVADMALRCEEARASVLRATLLADETVDEVARMRAVSSAKVKAARSARFVGGEAVQLHGAMGVTEELDIGSYFRSLVAFELRFGSADYHRQRFSMLSPVAN